MRVYQVINKKYVSLNYCEVIHRTLKTLLFVELSRDFFSDSLGVFFSSLEHLDGILSSDLSRILFISALLNTGKEGNNHFTGKLIPVLSVVI